MGRTENNHTAFIRIKTNKERESELLILPVEVEVTAGKTGLEYPVKTTTSDVHVTYTKV